MALAVAFAVAVCYFADLLVDDAVAIGQAQLVKHCLFYLFEVLLSACRALLVGC